MDRMSFIERPFMLVKEKDIFPMIVQHLLKKIKSTWLLRKLKEPIECHKEWGI